MAVNRLNTCNDWWWTVKCSQISSLVRIVNDNYEDVQNTLSIHALTFNFGFWHIYLHRTCFWPSLDLIRINLQLKISCWSEGWPTDYMAQIENYKIHLTAWASYESWVVICPAAALESWIPVASMKQNNSHLSTRFASVLCFLSSLPEHRKPILHRGLIIHINLRLDCDLLCAADWPQDKELIFKNLSLNFNIPFDLCSFCLPCQRLIRRLSTAYVTRMTSCMLRIRVSCWLSDRFSSIVKNWFRHEVCRYSLCRNHQQTKHTRHHFSPLTCVW